MKTNAARILDRLKVSYEILDYEVDPNNLDAEHIAGKLGLDAERVFKTLVVKGDRQGICFAVIPANTQLDLKQLARLSGDRKMSVVPLKDVQPLTGYIRGGVTVLGSKKPFPAYVHLTLQEFETIAVSAGMRGQMLLMVPQDYLKAVSGTVGAIAKPKSEASES
ncbi:MAG: Cys-tRNA(Pro) deacylase [Leptolyngbyaceae bacterium]|nr:Cys-tRNA(Pro) deacylase [Leptolyngbyaceae bacterium]